MNKKKFRIQAPMKGTISILVTAINKTEALAKGKVLLQTGERKRKKVRYFIDSGSSKIVG